MNDLDYIKSRKIKISNKEVYAPDFKRCSVNMGRRIYNSIKKPSKNVVFAFDSLNYFQFKKHFKGRICIDNLRCFTSVFPTGSPTSFSIIEARVSTS